MNEAIGTPPAIKDEQLFDRPLELDPAREAYSDPRTSRLRFARVDRPDNFPRLGKSKEDRDDC
jgi:hypothetical protein